MKLLCKLYTVNSGIRCTLLLGAYYLLGSYLLPSIRHHLLSACVLNGVHNRGKKSSAGKPWCQEHAVHSRVILKSKKMYAALLANKVTAHIFHGLQD